MEYVRLGSTGLEVSQLCLGTWKFGTESDGTVETDRDQAHDLLDAAADRGINFFDTANSYGNGRSEQYIGEWLADRDREDFVIASKVYWARRGRRERGLSRKIVRAEVEGTLDRLGTDYLDIYYIHSWHGPSPIEETLAVLDDLVREGKVRYIGASNLAAWQLTKSHWTSDVSDLERFTVVQPRYNAVVHDSVDSLLDVCRDQSVAVCGYSPLAGGFLTGKYGEDGDKPPGSRGALDDSFGDFSDREWAVLESVREVARETGATPAQVAIRWAMDIDGLSSVPIVGARSVEQLDENLGAVDVSLSDAQYDRIATAGAGEA